MLNGKTKIVILIVGMLKRQNINKRTFSNFEPFLILYKRQILMIN